jgi:copper homeostasis protein
MRTLSRAALRVMVRPRGGDFVVSGVEQEVVLADIAAIRALPNPHGLAVGVVVGALTADGDLDLPLLRRAVDAAGPLPVTVHKAFDELSDQLTALDQIVDLGADAILTSGGAPTALAGAAHIAALHARAAGRIRVIAAGGIRSHNVAEVLAATRATEIHLRAPVRQQGREATDPSEVSRVVSLAG